VTGGLAVFSRSRDEDEEEEEQEGEEQRIADRDSRKSGKAAARGKRESRSFLDLARFGNRFR